MTARATGLTTYARCLFPHLRSLNPTLLVSEQILDQTCYLIPGDLTPEQNLKGHFNRLAWTQFQLPKIYSSLNPNLLFSPIPEAPLFSQCRYVVTVHDLIPLRFPKRTSPLTPYFRYYIPQVLKQAQHVICNSTATAQDITSFFKIPAHKITPIPLACNTDQFKFLDLPPQNYFVYLGRSDPYKNLQRLIAAFAALPQRSLYELWLIGPTDKRYTPLLKEQSEHLGIANQVKILEYVPDVELPKIISQAIAMVFPSLWEGFGFPVLEAMACGTPVITSNLSSLPEVAGEAALLINPYSVSELTAAMQRVATESGLRSQLQDSGLARASQFSWAKTGQATVDLLKQHF